MFLIVIKMIIYGIINHCIVHLVLQCECMPQNLLFVERFYKILQRDFPFGKHCCETNLNYLLNFYQLIPGFSDRCGYRTLRPGDV